MEKHLFDYPAGAPAPGRALAGVVGSGDLEVLLEPRPAGSLQVSVTTSVNGMGPVWQAQLDRLFGARLWPAAAIEINDFGATPAVVRLRLEQAFESLDERE